MFQLACTRFNNQTYDENKEYRKKCNEAVIYGPSFKIRNTYSPDILIFVVEMNNETNKTEGIGLIRNTLIKDKTHRIYKNSEYNRIFYKGNYWLSRNQIDELDTDLNKLFDNILFKGKSHMKRLAGITVLTERLFTNWNYDLCVVKNRVKDMFLNYFKNNKDNNIELII